MNTGQWLQALSAGGPGADGVTDIVSLANGDLAVAGTLQAPISLGKLPAISGLTVPRAFVARLDLTRAQWHWVQQVQSDSLAQGQCLIKLPSGDLAVSGSYMGTARLDALTLPRGLGRYSSFVGRLRPDDGQWQWAASGGGTGRPLGHGGLAAMPNGDVVIMNNYAGRSRFGTLPEVNSTSKNPDIFVGQLSGKDGQWQWLTTAGGNGNGRDYEFAGDDFAGGIHALDSRHLLVTGTFSNAAYLGFNLGPLATKIYDGFVARITLPAACPDAVVEAPAPVRIVVDSTVCGPERTLRVVGAEPGSSFGWNTGATGPVLTVTTPGVYTVQISTLAGCRYQTRYTQTAADLARPTSLPNVITPNADGINDRWVVRALPAETRLRIFNRWGRLVYQTQSYTNEWAADGLAADVYYYVLENPTLCPSPRLKAGLK
ncbi:gliding motility-associated C-terminal domain-containing protein [Hymenobacter cellulosilyticus]|uniref:Gliding motility-associated C-terminal domain-containing protein n=1 Tax=Hymenobacter cellulosilyticus TaxID=2932248 RepID=A0A8T9QBF4_9BACT|nr:gliding motility-associated C-terminal domain-containing protein [Hymenobacter cellulosilyticus]UOQ74876.1 gliding motility-associated C-terminal domain-containing protein [Hymenobacter cellulosilyticus]